MLCHPPMISARQIRAARALLGWTQQELADRAILSVNAIKKIETGKTDPKSSTLKAIQNACESAGIEFQHAAGGKGEGVRLANP